MHELNPDLVEALTAEYDVASETYVHCGCPRAFARQYVFQVALDVLWNDSGCVKRGVLDRLMRDGLSFNSDIADVFALVDRCMPVSSEEFAWPHDLGGGS